MAIFPDFAAFADKYQAGTPQVLFAQLQLGDHDRRPWLVGQDLRRLGNLKDTLLAAKRPGSPAFDDLVTADEHMLSVLRYVETIASSPKPILIIGESGTGKELMAQAVHRLSGRTGPMVSLNIAGLDDTMFSDSLFGHRRGAFTGADADRGGLIERAE